MDQYTLGSLRYDLSKLRAKDLSKKVERTRRYRLSQEGYSICVVFLKRKDLRPSDHGSSPIGAGRHQASATAPHTTGSAPPTSRRGSGKALRQGRSQDRGLTHTLTRTKSSL